MQIWARNREHRNQYNKQDMCLLSRWDVSSMASSTVAAAKAAAIIKSLLAAVEAPEGGEVMSFGSV